MQKVMTVDEVAMYLHKSKYTIRNWIKRGLLPASRLGRSYFIAEDALAQVLRPAPRRKKLSRAESDQLLRKLREEMRAAGIGHEHYLAAMRELDSREEEAMREMREKWR